MSMEKKDQTLELLHEIRGVLACHQVSSIDSYPASRELLSFFDSCLKQSVEDAPLRAAAGTPQDIPKPEAESRAVNSNLLVLGEIADEVAQCRSCSLGGKGLKTTPGKGGSGKIRLLIIGDWLPTDDGAEAGAVFGVEEDQMLRRMLNAIDLPREDVFVTNVIKCVVGSGVQPQVEHIDACLSYLQRQIAAISPELICTMGMVAAKTLLRLSQPLSRLRGKFYTYKGAEGMEIPLLPTYHPGYLLQNPEMKNATWQDLQAIQKML